MKLHRPILMLFALLSLLIAARADAQEFDIPSVTIAGGDLAQSVELAPADADAFRRRVNQLPRLEDPPSVQGEAYSVTSSYWAVGVRLEDEEDALDVDVQADYYPDGAFVRVSIDGEDAWAVLNLRQRMILDRYIRLAEGGRIGEAPSTLEVLAADAGQEETAFGIAAGPHVLDYERGVELVSKLAEANPEPIVDPRDPPAESDGSYWLVVTLPEGRTLRYFYDGTTVVEGLGTERYDAAAVAEMLDGLAPSDLPAIAQQEPAGSLLWWPVMLGGGALAIGIAVWLRKRLEAPHES